LGIIGAGRNASDPVFFSLSQDGFKVPVCFDQVDPPVTHGGQRVFAREDSLKHLLVDLDAEAIPYSGLERRATIFAPSRRLDLFVRTLLCVERKRSPFLEVAVHNLRARAVELGGVLEDGLLEAVVPVPIIIIKKMQRFVEVHVYPG
jgi:hypothetical protein